MTEPRDDRPGDDRTALARAYGRASQVATIAIGMSAPPLAGRVADEHLGTRVLFTLFGAAFGLFFGIWHLLKLADANRRGRRDDEASRGETTREVNEDT